MEENWSLSFMGGKRRRENLIRANRNIEQDMYERKETLIRDLGL
jgi:hypothetical protein